ncbi:Pre-mRNA-splicing factor cwf19 [Rhodotorula kratochvilovae]
MGSHSRTDDRPSSSKHSRSSTRSHRDDDGDHSSKRHRSSRDDDKDRDRSSRHKHTSSSKRDRSRSRDRDSKHSRRSSTRDVANRDSRKDTSDDEWVEKGADTPAVQAKPPVDSVGTFSVGSMPTAQGLHRMEAADLTDGYGEGDVGGSSARGGGLFGELPQGEGASAEADFFGSFGTERRRKEPKEKPDPTQTMGQSSRELNKAYWQGGAESTPSSATAAAPASTGSPAPGSTGSVWRMTKLKRTYEAAEEEGRAIEDVALERYGSLEAFDEAREERRVLDQRQGRRGPPRRESGYGGGGGHAGTRTPTGMGADGGGRRFVFTDTGVAGEGGDGSRPGSRQGFRRPGEAPGLARSSSTSSLAGAASAAGSRPGTPIPSVFTPPVARRLPSQLAQSTTVVNPDPTSTGPAAGGAGGSSRPVLTQSELNKLQAKVLKAKLMDSDEAGALERQYDAELARAQAAGPALVDKEGMAQTLGGSSAQGQGVQVLPTMDSRGRMYDVGVGTETADKWEEERKNRGKHVRKEMLFESHDPKTGELIRNQADDDVLSLGDLVRQERFGGGSGDARQMDAEFADRIATDARFTNNLDYYDENAEKLARKKMKSEAMKRQFAINDYARTKKALDSCTMCYSDEGDPPKAPIVALGTRTYLALMETEELVPGHCRIVPVQHYLSCLEIDEEEGWDEIKNFMKTLMQMFAAEDKGVVFFETIISHKWQKHSYIEAIPVPFDLFDQLPIYFSEAINTSEAEWSQHKKLISFSPARPFRRSLVPNLPYFAVQFDYKGEKGFGHIIEGIDDAPDRDLDGEERRGEFGEQGQGEFPKFFAQEIIGNLLSLESRKWRKPRRVDRRENAARVAAFRKKYDQFDWTKMLAGGSGA